MRTAFILRLLVCVLVISFGAVDAFTLNYKAPQNSKDLCREISEKIQYRPNDNILGSLATGLEKINICKDNHSLWLWQADSEENEKLDWINKSATSRIQEIKFSELTLRIFFEIHFLTGIAIVMMRLLTSDTVKNLLITIKQKSMGGSELILKRFYRGKESADVKENYGKRAKGEILLLKYHPAAKEKEEILLLEYHPAEKQKEAKEKEEIFLIEYKVMEEKELESNSFLSRVSKLQKDMATAKAELKAIREIYEKLNKQ
jgi:hypothetical protein